MSNFLKPEYDRETNPVDYFNKYKMDYSIALFLKMNRKIKKVNETTYTVSNDMAQLATIKVNKWGLTIDNDNNVGLTVGKLYTPFMLLAKFQFKYNNEAAWTYIMANFLSAHIPYIRVGVDYFKKVKNIDRFDIYRTELKRWKKEEIKEDHGKEILKSIPKYDGFIMRPNNMEYSNTIGNNYNLFSEFSHFSDEGDWTWSKIMIKQIFGEYYELGLKYMQALYLHPTKALPILVLGSITRSTGKTTFLNWMAQIFGENFTVITPQELTAGFNGSYAFCNIIGIEETVDDKATTVNKIKGLSTGKFIPVNQKHIDNYKLPFFGKFIITTNQPERFLKIDDAEIRFWVHVLDEPKEYNSSIEEDLVKEIPAFLHHLRSLPALDFSKSRMLFTPEELHTEALLKVQKESKTWLYKELNEYISDWFMMEEKEQLFVQPIDIKKMFFMSNMKVEISFIKKVIREEFNLKTTLKRYHPYGIAVKKVAKVYVFDRKDFIDYDILKEQEQESSPPDIF